MGVLHTWGRQLHPHVHFVVPGGGLRADHRKWRKTRKPDWLLPGNALAAAFRRSMDEALHAAAPDLHAQLPSAIWRDGWWVHTQPAGSGTKVVRYLARYVGRTAISDERIVAATDEHVRFRYTDTATQQKRECTLSADEFMRRYLQHVLPPGLHRVRYFGWMHPAAKRRRMVVETLLAKMIFVRPPPPPEPKWHLQCRHCGAFALVEIGTIKSDGSVRLCQRATGPPTRNAA